MAINKVTTDVIDMSGNTGGLVWAKGATGDQPLLVDSTAGDLRENTTTGKTEVFNGTAWRNLKEIVPAVALTVDFLVVAGGGAGGDAYAGGGGAGGLRTSYVTPSGGGNTSESSLSLLTGTAYDVEVGNGGTSQVGAGSNGGDSIFHTITSIGGGGGAGAVASQSGLTGGSGGGGSFNGSQLAGAAVTSPAVQGYAGGTAAGTGGADAAGGGGGGAATLGGNASNGVQGNGGSGLEVNIIGGTGNYYAGGGGGAGGNNLSGGAGGIGGGGAGTNVGGGTGVNGTDGLGGGGGGNQGTYTNGKGGSGVVILRYPSGNSITVGSGLTTGVLNGTVSGGTDKYTTFTLGTGTITFS